MTSEHLKTTMQVSTGSRIAGILAISGAVFMLIGAAVWGSTGIDLWQALAQGELPAYLAAAGNVKLQFTINTAFWITGVLCMGSAGTLMAALPTRRQPLALMARLGFQTGVPLAIVAFLAMVSVVIQLSPDTSAVAVAVAETVGWIGARADDIATILIAAVGPLLISLAGKDHWVPRWLLRWGYAAGIGGFLAAVAIFLPGFYQLGLVLIPIAMGWMIAAGVVLLSRRTAAAI
ncbi:MAG: hypothetical protein R2824_03375 [Saprospiraceae bacterium]